MQVRQVQVSDADCESAKLFFSALTGFFDFSAVDALDMFARTGALTVVNYFHSVANFDVWELRPEHKDALEKYMPRDIRIGCSYQTLVTCVRRYGLIVIDTPQGLHTGYDGVVHTEHFEILQRLSSIMADRCVVVVYVNKRPYNKQHVGSHGYDHYDEYDFNEWMENREVFYGDAYVTDARALTAYERVFRGMGRAIANVVSVPCYSDVGELSPYAYRLAMEVVR